MKCLCSKCNQEIFIESIDMQTYQDNVDNFINNHPDSYLYLDYECESCSHSGRILYEITAIS